MQFKLLRALLLYSENNPFLLYQLNEFICLREIGSVKVDNESNRLLLLLLPSQRRLLRKLHLSMCSLSYPLSHQTL